MNITEIVPKNNYLLYIEADDGQAGLFDVAPYLESEAFAPLKDPGEFERIHNGNYFIEWECGADLSADTIETRWTPMTQPVSENETIHPVTVVTAFFDSKAKNIMKLEFDPAADAAYFEISSAPVERTEEIEPGINADHDAEGCLLGIEVLSVSKRNLSEQC